MGPSDGPTERPFESRRAFFVDAERRHRSPRERALRDVAALRSGPVGRSGRLARLRGELAPPLRRTVAANFAPESARVLREVMRPRTSPRGAGGVPALVVAGDRDPLLPPPMAAAFADALGAEHQPLAGAGHWLLAGVAWQRTVGLVHRWIVQRLGEPLLERYAEAMAEREDE